MLDRQRVVRWIALTATAVAVGLTSRFWRSVVAPLPRSELTIDWSSLVYGFWGGLASIVALKVVAAADGLFTAKERRSLRAVSTLCVLGYVGCMGWVVWWTIAQ